MSYNQAYEQDSGENVSYNSLYSLDVNNRRNTLLPVIKSFQITPPPPPPTPQPVVYFDLQTWEANQTVISRDGSIYETVLTSYPDYVDGLTWGLKPKAPTISMTENVTFPPSGGGFKLELVWKDYGNDGASSYGFTFHSSGVLGFLFQKSGIKVAMFLSKEDGTRLLFKPHGTATQNDTPLSITYKQIFTYYADTRGYVFEHFEGDDLTIADLSSSGVIPIEDGDWGYGPNTEYELKNNGNQEYLNITVTAPPPSPSLFDVDFIANGQILEGSGLAESIVTTDSQNYLFNAEGQFESTDEYLYVYMTPTNWSALVPAIQSTSQVKLKITLVDGPTAHKLILQHNANYSGFNIRIYGNSTSSRLTYLSWIVKGVNGNGTSNNQYFHNIDISNILSFVPDLYDKEHEWRFEHKLLYDDPDGNVEAEIYCDDVLIHTEKFNYANTGTEQRLIGFNFDTRNNGPFSLRLGDIGTKLTSISIDEKPN